MGPDFTFFVVYGSSTHLVNLDDVHVVEREYPLLSAKDANLTIRKQLRRKLVVVGACIGTDAHTVGIDAILNIKGFAGEKGLEYYREIRVVNLGAQVLVPELVARARAEKADAVLVSQVVTQKDAHIHNTTQMSAAFREAYPAGQVPILIAGGPRFEEGSEGGARGRPHLRPRHDSRRGRELPRARDDRAEGALTMSRPVQQATPRGRTRAEVGLRVVHRRYVPYAHAHYAGNLVDGAYSLAAFGDVATEMCIRTDGDEGLFASYSDVQFRERIKAGDVIEISAEIVRVGRAVARARLRGARRRPRAPRAQRVLRRDARPAGRRHDGPRHRRRPLTGHTHPGRGPSHARAPRGALRGASPRGRHTVTSCVVTVGSCCVRLVVALGGGGLLCLAFPTFDVWVAAPLAMALLAWSATGLGARRGLLAGVLFGLAFFVPTLSWSGIYVGALPWLALATLESLFVGLAGALYGWLSRAGRVRPLAFALVWVVTEGFRARAPYGGFPWLKLAFSQADSPVGRLVALGGAPFVGFVLALAGGLLALAAHHACSRTARHRSGMPWRRVALPVAAALVLGGRGPRRAAAHRRPGGAVPRGAGQRAARRPRLQRAAAGRPRQPRRRDLAGAGRHRGGASAHPRPRRVARERVRHRPGAQRRRALTRSPRP